MKYHVFNAKPINMLDQPMFFGETPNIARYDVQKYPVFEKLYNRMIELYWRPEEIDLSKDMKDFKELSSHEQSIMCLNLKRQILLDSVQERSLSVALLPVVSLPELEPIFTAWSFFETIHSRSYTYLIQNVFSDPSPMFESIINTPEIVGDAENITKYYDDFIEYSSWYNLLGYGTHNINNELIDINEYELKKRLYLMLIAVNILEGIRFYVSFACSWAIAQQKRRMEGNAKIIKLICRDENIHLGITQTILKILPKDDPIYLKIAKNCESTVISMYSECVESEKQWARYLFKDGSMLGLNEQLLGEYVEYIANRRMKALGLPMQYKRPNDPLSWTKDWINSGTVQVAPQEVEITSYTIGALKQDVVEGETFTGFEL